MFGEAIKQYAKIIHGNKTYLSIIFHALTGAIIGTLLFLVINASSDSELTILNAKIGINTKRMFLLDLTLLNLPSPVSKETNTKPR